MKQEEFIQYLYDMKSDGGFMNDWIFFSEEDKQQEIKQSIEEGLDYISDPNSEQCNLSVLGIEICMKAKELSEKLNNYHEQLIEEFEQYLNLKGCESMHCFIGKKDDKNG